MYAYTDLKILTVLCSCVPTSSNTSMHPSDHLDNVMGMVVDLLMSACTDVKKRSNFAIKVISTSLQVKYSSD